MDHNKQPHSPVRGMTAGGRLRITVAAAFAAMAALVSCGGGDDDFDATGTFEATEVTVSAEANGRLTALDIEEGTTVRAGEVIGAVDTVQLHLRKLQLIASAESLDAGKNDVDKQIAATRQQLATARHELQRVERLLADDAATQKQLDDAASLVNVLEDQLAAQLSSLTRGNASIDNQSSSIRLQVLQVEDQIAKSLIASPVNGTVLEQYAECGEMATVGKPLFKVADLTVLELRAYLTSAQLFDVQLGDSVRVFADYGDGRRREYGGRVSWISQQSEFTPKTILTDDERANLVYAVKVRVRNDGYLKLGMFGEVKF